MEGIACPGGTGSAGGLWRRWGWGEHDSDDARDEPPGHDSPVITPAPAVTSVSAPALSSFTAKLSEDVSSVGVGGTVNYTVTLTNSSGAAATVTTNTVSGVNVPDNSLSIRNSTGKTVYPPGSQPGMRPLDAPPPPPPPLNSGVVTLQPGQSISQTRAISVFSQAGAYQAVATFTVAANSTDTPQTVTLSALPVTVK